MDVDGTASAGAWQPRWARPVVLAGLGASVLVIALLLTPVPDGPRRWIALGLVVVLFALQIPFLVRARRIGRRPLTPRWLRITHQAALYWGVMSAVFYGVPPLEENSAFNGVVFGTAAAVLFGALMWFVDPDRHAPTTPLESR